MYFESYRDNKAYYAQEQDNSCRAHFHRSTEILLITKGEKRVEVNGKAYLLQENDVLFCPPFSVHTFFPSQNSTQIVATILPEYSERFERFCETHEPSTYTFHDDGEVKNLIERLQVAQNTFLQDGASAMLIGLFVDKTKFVKMPNKSTNKIRQIVEYIEQHYTEPLTLSVLAKQFGYAPSYFSAMFKKSFYMSVPQYINAVRIEKSLPLLKTHAISSVYFLCGFKNPQQYFLQFKKVHGCTPYAFMKRG